MTEPQHSVRDIINKYSPIVNGRSGPSSLFFKAAARSLEALQSTAQAASDWVYPSGIQNTAGQLLVNTPPIIAATFARMERRLQDSFRAAASKYARPLERENFHAVAEEVKADASVIAPQATVLRQEFDMVTEPYKFMVTQTLTLEQGIASLAPVPAAEVVVAKMPPLLQREPVTIPVPAPKPKTIAQ
ncbi:MAG TPA: hypothetical protein VEF76_13130 [Patescibacteria group bacterium]|nr:hypothetical protein [Patescibacteria group bacterium]